MRRQARRLQACLGDAGSAAGTLLSERLASSGLASASGTAAGAVFATATQGLQRGDRRALRAAVRAYATLVRQQGGQAGAVVAGAGTGAAGLRRTLQARALLSGCSASCARPGYLCKALCFVHPSAGRPAGSVHLPLTAGTLKRRRSMAC